MKLYETNHPYYMSQGCYFDRGCHHEYESWEDFLEEWRESDIDYNWIIRWDWSTLEDMELTPINHEDEELLQIQFFLQRKSYPISCYIRVNRDQEPEIKEFLNKYWLYMKEMWAPFSEEKV